MLKGLTLPNRQWDAYTPAELAALDDLAPGVIVWLLYGGSIDATHSAQLRPFIERVNPRILFRPYAGNIPLWSPSEWSRECYKRIITLGWHGELLPANEMNLAIEHGSEDWASQIAWLKDFAAAWKTDGLGDPLHLPALSPSGDWGAGLRAYHAAGLDLLFDRIDCHAYGPDAAAIVSMTSANLAGPLDVTECNQIDPALLFSQIEHGVESATWFLLGGTEDQQQYDLLRLPAEYDSFKRWRPTLPTPKPPTRWTAGIDVSNHQSTIDWPLAARSGIFFAIIKASESTDYTDKFFPANWQAAKDNGLVRGAYGFGRPSAGSGRADAEFFLSKITDLQAGDLLALDLEDDRVEPGADLLAYTLDWLRTVEAAVGFKPLLYSGHYYLEPHNLEGHADLAEYGLWLASYQSTVPPSPKGWPFWAIWQHSDAGRVPGIGKCDVDLFAGSLAQLKKYGRPT